MPRIPSNSPNGILSHTLESGIDPIGHNDKMDDGNEGTKLPILLVLSWGGTLGEINLLEFHRELEGEVNDSLVHDSEASRLETPVLPHAAEERLWVDAPWAPCIRRTEEWKTWVGSTRAVYCSFYTTNCTPHIRMSIVPCELRFGSSTGKLRPQVMWLAKAIRSFGCTKSMKDRPIHMSLGKPRTFVIVGVIWTTTPSSMLTAVANPSWWF